MQESVLENGHLLGSQLKADERSVDVAVLKEATSLVALILGRQDGAADLIKALRNGVVGVSDTGGAFGAVTESDADGGSTGSEAENTDKGSNDDASHRLDESSVVHMSTEPSQNAEDAQYARDHSSEWPREGKAHSSGSGASASDVSKQGSGSNSEHEEDDSDDALEVGLPGFTPEEAFKLKRASIELGAFKNTLQKPLLNENKLDSTQTVESILGHLRADHESYPRNKISENNYRALHSAIIAMREQFNDLRIKGKFSSEMDVIAAETHTLILKMLENHKNAAEQFSAIQMYNHHLKDYLPVPRWQKIIVPVLIAAALLIGPFIGAVIGGALGAFSGPGAVVTGAAGALLGLQAVALLFTGQTALWASASAALLASQIGMVAGGTAVLSAGEGIAYGTAKSRYTPLRISILRVQNAAGKEEKFNRQCEAKAKLPEQRGLLGRSA